MKTAENADTRTEVVELHRTMPIQIFHTLAFDIIEERYNCGERLHEQHTAARFGVSRAPVREAFRILEKHGLITIEPQRGARVKELSEDELAHLFEIRSVLVGLATLRTAQNPTPEVASDLNTVLASLQGALHDPLQYSRVSAAATIEIARLSANPELEEMITSFAYRIGRYTKMGLSSQSRRNESVQNWKNFVAAIISGRCAEAEQTQQKLAYKNREEALKIVTQRREGRTNESSQPKTLHTPVSMDK